MTRERFEGCLLGLALGDALGAPHEGGMIERLVWRVIGKTPEGHRRWTDDTQMSLDLGESLVARGCLDLDDLARRFASSYHWSRGYGPGAAKLLRRIAKGADWRVANRSIYPQGSFGNGGAMRAPVIGLFYAHRPRDIAAAARLSASVTHSHELGVEGAVLMALATACALRSKDPVEILDCARVECALEPFATRLAVARAWLGTGKEPPLDEVRQRLGNRITASESCVTALYLALGWIGRPFPDLQKRIVRLGGDVDTIGAMAGAIWGAANGVAGLPPIELGRLEQRARLESLASDLFATMPQSADASETSSAS